MYLHGRVRPAAARFQPLEFASLRWLRVTVKVEV